jgi:hypothetical protein
MFLSEDSMDRRRHDPALLSSTLQFRSLFPAILQNVSEKAQFSTSQYSYKIQGVFKNRPDFCYKDFIAHFTAL